MLVIPAYAKVNLCLAVRGRRADGFHEIDSVAVAIDWHDLVGLSIRPAGATAVRLRVTGGGGDAIPDGEDNLAVRAAAAMAALAGPILVDVWLHKRLPSAAGLGGGSADASAVLRGLDALARTGGTGSTPLDERTLRGVAASLGSDVPVLLAGGAQRMTGRGEQLTALAVPPLHLVVAIAGASSTAAAYAATREDDYDRGERVAQVAVSLAAGRAPGTEILGSSLEGPACRANPALARGLARLRESVPEAPWHLTGSGGAAFAVAGDAVRAERLAGAARAARFVARACRTVTGPAAQPLKSLR